MLMDAAGSVATPNNAIRLRDLLQRVRHVVQNAFSQPVWVLAEVQDIKIHERGHVYLTLVDVQESQVQVKIKGNLWNRSGAERLRELERARGERLRRGEKVFVFSTPEYHPQYAFSVTIADIQFADTLGPAERALRDAIKRLTAEGVISRNKELAVPQIVFRVALVAPSAAEGSLDFQSILLRERYRAPILCKVFQATFQSEQATYEIPIAIGRACNWRPDVIVLARGGGSKADLLYLNNYSLGCAICECQIPVWSGIGHSTDKTLVHEVAQRVFKTPSDAAHEIVNLVARTLNEIDQLRQSTARSASTITFRTDQRLRDVCNGLKGKFLANVEKAALKSDEATKVASSSARIIEAVWAKHLAMCRQQGSAVVTTLVNRSHMKSTEQATKSVSASNLVCERWMNTLQSNRVCAIGAVQRILDSQDARKNNCYALCTQASRLFLARLRERITQDRTFIGNVTGRCLARRRAELEASWHRPKKMTLDALERAFGVVRQRTHSLNSMTQVALRSIRADCDRTIGDTNNFSRLIGVRAQTACDRLRATIESSDFHGPLARGFVMVFDHAGCWLRSAVDTIPRMRLNYHDGVVHVRKDET